MENNASVAATVGKKIQACKLYNAAFTTDKIIPMLLGLIDITAVHICVVDELIHTFLLITKNGHYCKFGQ